MMSLTKELDIQLKTRCFNTIQILLLGGYVSVDDVFNSFYVDRIVYNEALFKLVESNITPEIASIILGKMVNRDESIHVYYWERLFEFGGKIKSADHWLIPDEVFLNYVQHYHEPYQLSNKLTFVKQFHCCTTIKQEWFINEFANEDISAITQILSIVNVKCILLLSQKNITIRDNLKYFVIHKFIYSSFLMENTIADCYEMGNLMKNILHENEIKEILMAAQISRAIKWGLTEFLFMISNNIYHTLTIHEMPNHKEMHNLIKSLPKEKTYTNIVNYIDQLLLLMPPIIDFIYEQFNKKLKLQDLIYYYYL